MEEKKQPRWWAKLWHWWFDVSSGTNVFMDENKFFKLYHQIQIILMLQTASIILISAALLIHLLRQ